MELFLRRRNRSPLLLAVIFITFFHSVLSRHRIRHYKDRFKRQQGAHLYLPESYVTEGGDGPDQGPWMDWSEPSPCSRTCGGGVSSQYRQCQEGYACQGPDKKHFTCNTQDCPDTGDFRSQQCSEYDEVPFENVKYQWVPYTKGPNPCELNCMPKGQRFYYRHAPHVIDGTRCNDESLDVCVNGECQPVGCDMMLGSNLKEDECRICGGDGSTCNTITNTLELNDMQVGYNDILLIPGGATNIVVEEVSPSNNYLAVRNTSGHYYLNGNWRIDFPRAIDFAGSKFHYERYPQGFAAPDKVYTLGPIDEPLFIVLLYQDSTVPVTYKYSLPTNVQPGSEYETYAWTFDEYTPCTETCGGGIQHRNVSCAGRKTLEPVDETLCDSGRKPETSRRCNEVACEAQWVPHPWGNCSAPCGEDGGVQTREISCQQVVSNGYPSLVDESECHGPKPPQQQKCNQGKTCASWHTGPWKPCDHLCGDGKQTRKVRCFIKDENNKIQTLEDSQCEAIEPRPAEEQNCFTRPCEGVDWIISEWSGCDSICGLTNETRKIFCATADGQIYGDELCDQSAKPETVRTCEGSNNESCNFLWYASQWSECSVKCGKGIETRTIFCGLSTADGVKKVENEKCDQNKSFEIIRNCTGTEECDGEWFSGPWGECSKACGGGVKTKKVVCIKGADLVDFSHCDESKIVFSNEDCNKDPCTQDSELPVKKDDPLKLQDKETEKPTTEVALTTESETLESAESTVASSVITSKESDRTETDNSSSDISEMTKSFDYTTERQAEESDKEESEDEYEFVRSDSCDDGEWVEIDVKVGIVDMTEETELTSGTYSEETVESTTSGTTQALETSYSIYDTMMSDGTTIEETPFTGSGDGESSLATSPSSDTTEEEGSGSEPSSIVTDDEISVSYISSSQAVSGSTESTQSETGSTESSETPITAASEISTISTAETSTTTGGDTDSTDSSTDVSVSSTDITGSSTEESSTNESGATKASASTEEGSSVSGETTTESGTTETPTDDISTATSDSSSSESSTTSFSGSTETSTTEFTDSTETSTTEFTDSSKTTESTDTSETTITIENTELTESTSAISTERTGSTTEIIIQKEPGPEIGTPPPRLIADEETEETTEGTTETSGSTETSESTESSGSTEFSSMSTTESFTGSTLTEESSESGATNVTEMSTTEVSGSTETTEVGSTETTETTESGTTVTTESGATETTVSGTVETTESGTTMETTESEATETTVSEETTETATTESTTDFTGSTEFDIFSSTTEGGETTTWPTSHITDIFKKKQRMCKRKKILQCKKTTYGCCWDNIHAAQGPFDKGCPTPKTCKESTYGCCPDGVSAALGPKNRGCPSSHCNETLFGCCWDKKTPAEGNDEEGCPPKPPACLESEWGCCKDNVTEAKGPKQKGCEPEKEKEEEKESEKPEQATAPSTEECQKTDYGCCPDGSPAKGPQYQGCNMPCSNSTYGCCPDKETPAHGYRREGCCLNSAFGCCPDDITPARGPNGDGCECQYSPYGCCPDQITPAQGYDKEGCGCKYSQHGCCPDEATAASGPDFEGCPCHTFQFGCCPDGVSVAVGPHQQGCDCRTSEFGCCSNEKTRAQGPNQEGCTCDVSKYGCCLDGVTEAKGEDFEGCEEIPVDHQTACSLPKDRGPCRNYTVKWFFDMSYGGCSRFWYGGCEGNDNRFRSKEECEGVCVKPQGIERCNLPKVNGSCEGYFLQWYFDKQSRQCSQFVYGGCLGNNNKFETREECTELCSKDDSADPCEQSKAEGPCRGQFRRYFFDKSSGQCQEFVYGGCRGNNNNFASVEGCKQRCATPGKKRDYCTIPKAEGNCTAREAKWYYGTKEQRCLPFYYTGCNGNKNTFDSKDACQGDCPNEVVKDTCHLPADIGECGNYVSRWYWDTRYRRCSQFYWGGCGGNSNNYETEQQCKETCENRPEPEQTQPFQTPPPQQPEPQQPEPQPTQPSQTSRQPTLEEICSMVPDPGPCTDYAVHYYYDGTDAICKNFTYGGCSGNYNNFENEDMCLQYCGSTRVIPPVVYDTTQRPKVEEAPVYDTQCYEAADPGNCTDQYQAFYYDANTGECKEFVFTGCGGNRNRFYSEEQCQRQCGTYRGQDVCNMDSDAGPCRGYNIKYYFDRSRGSCIQFAYGGCQGNGNRFGSVEECEHYCGRPEEPKTSLTPAAVVEPGIGPHECQAKFDECTSLRCPYGIEAFVDESECNGCRCRDPCKDVDCPEGTQCAIDLNRNKTSIEDADYVAICRESNKTGECPYIPRNDSNCENECKNDADCALHLKCCSTDCGTVCVEPQKRPGELVTQASAPGYTTAPQIDVYYPPRIDVQIYEPEVSGLLGDEARLNCAVSGNPNPKIVWRKDNVLIDGTQPRYRIRLDQTLQIITLHKTDSGVYLCTADNNIGAPIQNQIKLEVLDSPNPRPVKILNEEDPELFINNVVTSFNSPATLNCYALGWPMPAVTWWKEDELIPLKNREFEVTKEYSLLINSVQLRNLGVYTCQAYNGKGKAASWSVTVKAKGPYYSTNPGDIKYLQYVVNPPELITTSAPTPEYRSYPPTQPPHWPVYSPVQRPTPQSYIPPEVYSTEPNPDLVDPNEIFPHIPEAAGHIPDSIYIVPVRANITTNEQRYPTGSNVQIRCDVYGYPPPQVQWYKDGIPLYTNDRILESETHILTIKSAEKADSGVYQCEATNQYSKASSTLQVLIEGMFIHPSCTDNQFFANCKLIVKAKFCNHKYYAKFCCRSCTEAGQLPYDVEASKKQNALDTNII